MRTLPYLDISGFPIKDSLRLIRTTNVGPVAFFNLISRYKSPAKALEAIPEIVAKSGGKRNFKLPEESKINLEIELLEKNGARIVPYGSQEYSSLLSSIYDPPPLLFTIGNLSLMQQSNFAIVGSRNATANGKLLARKIAGDLGKAAYVIVSGLARGIDTEAHNAAISSGTIGVIAGGIDNIYPPENKKLYDMMAKSGLIISEQPFGSLPTPTTFPRRNRIISGLAKGVLVVEASLNSGSLITARMAAEQGRDVFAIPGSPLDARSKGCNKLIREGAVLIEDADEIIASLQLPNKSYLSSFELQGGFQLEDLSNNEDDVEFASQNVMESLSTSPTSLDELAGITHIPVGLIRTALLELELAGKVERLPGNRFIVLYKQEAA